MLVVAALGRLGIGLRPAVPTSVAPKGMATLFGVETVPGADSGDAVPEADTVDELDMQPVEDKPPPSKALLVPVLQAEVGAGLRPPGLTSVAANGRPVPPR